MLKEQLETVRLFREHQWGLSEKMVLYGTGIHAEAIVKNCGEYPITGIMDVTKEEKEFCGLPILSQEEIVEKQVKKIVLAARPAVHGIIYKRIQKWCEDNQIRVYDICGNDIAQKLKKEDLDSPYFDVCFEQLKQEIDSHEIISFDIFDTLLMRRVYEPSDVFSLVEMEVGGSLPFSFSKARKEAEQELLQSCEPDIFQIYRLIGKKENISWETCLSVMEKELQKEKEVLVARRRMKECMEYCRTQGKKVFLVSDMYLTSDLLRELLEQSGITGYEEILVSCEHGVSKPGGLFRILKNRAEGKSYLHIGDNEAADQDAARENGIDAFLILSAVRMMELSAYHGALSYIGGIGSRVMTGLLASEIFNDPFALYHSKGRPKVDTPERFGFALTAPLVLSFLVWMLGILAHKEDGIVLFAARDGWLIRQIYQTIVKQWKIEALPRTVYFMTSRKALFQVGRDREHKGSGEENSYLDYLNSLRLKDYQEVYFFDFMSRGTCQSELERITGRKMTGIYFQKSISGIREKDDIEVVAFYKEKSAHENNRRIFAMCDFLECIITSDQPSFTGIKKGEFQYEEEKRSKEQLECLKGIHRGIRDYCRRFSVITGRIPPDMSSVEFCDEVLRYTSAEFSVIDIPALKEFMLYDWLGGDKNTGADILM